jgi:predicted nucleic acid-binding Zn ribbon protein
MTTPSQRFCPKCGTANKGNAKFCRNCGENFTSGQVSAAETVEKASDVVNKVTSTVSKVQSTVQSAEKIVETTSSLSSIVIRPPAQWQVVVGDILPATGQKMVESAVTSAERHVQQQVGQKVQEEVVRQVSKVVSKPGQAPFPESVVRNGEFSQQPQPGPQPVTIPGRICQQCGNPIKPGAKFCGSCGAGIIGSSPVVTTPVCPSCGKPFTPGKKFCGSCGQKLD